MFHDQPTSETHLWHRAGDGAYVAYFAAVHAAAVKRGEDDSAEGDDSAG
jgi:hypothetical protein